MYAVLEIASGPNRGQTFEVRPGRTLKVGRHDQANLVLRDDAMMSNVHFTLECDGQVCRIRDLNSRFGTQVNHVRVTEATLRDGDRVAAGSTTFVIRILGADAAAEAVGHPQAAPPIAEVPMAMAGNKPAARPPLAASQGIAGQVLQVLRRQHDGLYALLDAARDPLVLARLAEAPDQWQTLYEGPQGEALAAFGPFLVKLPAESPFLEALVRDGWGQSWGVFLTCPLPFPEVRKHLRRFLTVKLPNGRPAYFRFYDPRVLRAFLPTLNAQETTEFFGPIACYLMEDESPQRLVQFQHDRGKTRRDLVPVGASS